ncbi:MAG TPA: heme exporter protein CcmD [Verrucomicrobiae bacterium]|nr:heme exporter protein CcmD [Verrucomicrobiae bacterium]
MNDFWNMGGYALYVWGSYGACLAVLAWNLASPALARRALLKRLKAQQP